jgi:hypothetical protein
MDRLTYNISENRPFVFETLVGKDINTGEEVVFGYRINYCISQNEDGLWQHYTLDLSTTMYDYIKGDSNKVYECVISKIVRQRYPDNDMTAILSNYLNEPDNEKYIKEFREVQDWRKVAKSVAKYIVDNEII